MFKKNRAVSLSSQGLMANRQGLFLSLLLLLMGLAQLACGSSGGGNNSPTAPTAVTYSTNPAVYTEDVAIAANIPTVTGGAVTSFAVAPALPAGLSLNAATGVITGTPSAVSGAASYQVTASNAAGSARVTLSIAVTAAPVAPTITTQPQASQAVAAGASVSFTVVATGTAPLTYQWRKGGVAIAGATSATYTIPSAVVGDSGTYTVTVSNGTAPDAVSQNAVLTVTPASPLPVISYPSSPCTFFVGTAIAAVNPSNSGGAASSWGITPALPAGLAFSISTGVITGTPTAAGSAANFTVTASNAAGSGQAILSITVRTPDNSYGAVSASRTSGVAPLSVHFSTDYSGTPAGSQGFHNYDYSWTFGDPSSGVWGTNGKSKNTAKGAVAAHVFETAGTYSVTLTVRDQNGVIGAESFTISVDDPEVFYAGTKTTCVNPAGDTNFTGAPSGSRQISTDDLSSITQYATAGSRILFKRGAAWTTSGLSNWPENAGPVTIGAYGAGSNPDEFGIFANAPLFTITSGTFLPTAYKQDWRIMDLTFTDPSRQFGVLGGITLMQRHLYLRLKITGFSVALGWGHWNNPVGPQIDEMSIVSCILSDSATNVCYVGSERLVLLGNSMENAVDSHVLRVWQSYKGVISNNRMSGSSLGTNTGRQAMKLHGPGEEEVSSTTWSHISKRTEFTMVSDNLYGSSGPWPVSVGPADNGQDCRMSNIIFERNRYCADYGTRSSSSTPLDIPLHFHVSQLTVRNNIVDASNFGPYFTGISIFGSGRGAPPSKDVWIYNNSFYKAGNPIGRSWAGIQILPGVQSVIIRNNIVLFPYTDTNHIAVIDEGAGTVQSNNCLNGAVMFVDPDNTSYLLRTFALMMRSSGAIDKGYPIPSVFEDFVGNSRPAGAAHDIGAHEFR